LAWRSLRHVLRFRHLLEEYNLTEKIFAEVPTVQRH